MISLPARLRKVNRLAAIFAFAVATKLDGAAAGCANDRASPTGVIGKKRAKVRTTLRTPIARDPKEIISTIRAVSWSR
ncbi:MAG: hypothetical protein AMXMBFR20_35920 [Planctomycetia bacterium]